jgi:hypothetical protein
MADFVAEQTAPSRLQPDDRAAATWYLTRTGNADVLEVLGLVEEPEPVPPAEVAKKPRHRKGKAS